MLLKTKYWRYFLRLCTSTGFEVSTLQDMVSSLEQGCEKRVGDYSFRLVSKEKERFGTVYKIEVYERQELVLKSPVLLHEPQKERRRGSRKSRENDNGGISRG